mgnify:CR=1 FL=1
MKIIAITGSIGCGKTYIANLIKSLGYTVFDADKEVRYFYKNEKFLNCIKTFFSDCFENGLLNKRKLRELVFNNNEKLKTLESIIHPLLKTKLQEKIRKSYKTSNFLFIDAALIFEMKWDIYCDYIILADVDKKIQKQRVMKRDNISEQDFEKIVNKQMSNNKKIEKSDIVLNTELSGGKLKALLIKFLNEIENA